MNRFFLIFLLAINKVSAANIFIKYDAFYGPAKVGFGIFQIVQTNNNLSIEASFASAGVISLLKNASGSITVKTSNDGGVGERLLLSSGIWGELHSLVKVMWDDSILPPKVEKFRSKPLEYKICLLYTSPSPRDRTRSRMPSSA